MWRVMLTVGSGGETQQMETLSSPAEAEALYLRLIQDRQKKAAAVHIVPARAAQALDAVVAPGRYRVDRKWKLARELEHDRWHQLWAPASEWVGPTPWQLRALPIASGLSGSEIARRIGVGPRQWRRWLSDPDSHATRIPYAAWVAALCLTGLLPDGEHSPSAPAVR